LEQSCLKGQLFFVRKLGREVYPEHGRRES